MQSASFLREILIYGWKKNQMFQIFDIAVNNNVNKKVACPVLIITADHEKGLFTVILACICGGTKLPPYVNF